MIRWCSSRCVWSKYSRTHPTSAQLKSQSVSESVSCHPARFRITSKIVLCSDARNTTTGCSSEDDDAASSSSSSLRRCDDEEEEEEEDEPRRAEDEDRPGLREEEEEDGCGEEDDVDRLRRDIFNVLFRTKLIQY